MAEPKHPPVPGALSIIAEQLPRWWRDQQTADLRNTVESLVPQDAVDAGLMLLGGPGGKIARKAGAALVAGGASTDAQAGIYTALPSKLKGIVSELVRAARSAHPQGAIEFANNGVTGNVVRGVHEFVPASKLRFVDDGVAIHTHPEAGPAIPSLTDFELWRNQPTQRYLGVARPQQGGRESAVIIAPKRNALPLDSELLKHQMSLARANPELSKLLDARGEDASLWKWLLDAGARNDIDLFLHNTQAPAFKHMGNKVPALQKAGPPMSKELLEDIATHIDYNGGVSPLLQQHLDAGPVLTAPKTVYRAIPTGELERNLRPGDIYNFSKHNSSTSQSMRGIERGVLPQLEEAGLTLGDNLSLFKIDLPTGEAFGQAIRSKNRHPINDLQDEFLLRKSPPIKIESIGSDGTINGKVLPQDGKHFFAEGGPVLTHNQDQMTHKKSSAQDQSTQPLTGSALQALARGWLAGTIGLPGDLEGLGRAGLNALGAGVDKHAALPTTDFFKEWLPGKQTGDENVATVGSMLGGAGVGTARQAVRNAAKAAPGALTQMARNAATPRQLSTQAGVIKAPGGNWLSESVKNSLHGVRGSWDTAGVQDSLAALQKELDAAEPGSVRAEMFKDIIANTQRSHAVANFVDKQLTRYVRDDLATVRDPIRALAEKGPIHIVPNRVPLGLAQKREAAGFPASDQGVTPAARLWERAADDVLEQRLASEYQHAQKNIRAANPWLDKVSPDVPVNRIAGASGAAQQLGFDHLIDELRNATNPASGLPRELLLKPESLDRVSVPQAVEHVAKINAWREAQKVEASQKLANNAATHLFKEYAENNPKGLRWVELKHTGDDLPFQDAVRYEGDTMGHSVGGYASEGMYGQGGLQAARDGHVKLFSLRDAKGQPHVTVEARPGVTPPEGSVRWHDLPETLQADMSRRGLAPSENELINTYFDPQKGTRYLQFDPQIIQIKGKSNKKPNDEYLPFVQDFVKSGKWSDVGDLQNSGLIKNSGKRAEALGPYATEAELTKYLDSFPDTTPGYAQGGAVPTDSEIQQFYAAHKDDPAALAAAMQQYGVGANTAAKALGQTQEQLVAHVNSGRVETPVMTGGPDPADTGARTWNYAAITPEVTQSLDQFKQKYAHAIGPDGRFKGPQSGIDYAAEGLTPEEYYKAHIGQQYQRSGEYGSEQTPTVFNTSVNADWRKGPDNGGGVLGGVTRAVGGLAKGVMSNPALSMALTAGLAPMVGKGLQSAGMSAGMAKTAAPLVSNAVKTVAGGGSLADAAKNAGIGYLGGQAGRLTEGATGLDFAGKVASSVTQSALRGKPLSIDALATQYATGKITDLSGLDPSVASIVVNLAKRKRPSATGALSALAKYSQKPKI